MLRCSWVSGALRYVYVCTYCPDGMAHMARCMIACEPVRVGRACTVTLQQEHGRRIQTRLDSSSSSLSSITTCMQQPISSSCSANSHFTRFFHILQVQFHPPLRRHLSPDSRAGLPLVRPGPHLTSSSRPGPCHRGCKQKWVRATGHATCLMRCLTCAVASVQLRISIAKRPFGE